MIFFSIMLAEIGFHKVKVIRYSKFHQGKDTKHLQVSAMHSSPHFRGRVCVHANWKKQAVFLIRG